MNARLAGLYLYPVKSAAGIPVAAAQLRATGLAHDREWMLVDASGRFLTQRELPQLALLHTRIEGDTLRLLTPAGELAPLPLAHEGDRVEVQVWRSRCRAFDAGTAWSVPLSEWLARPVRLVRFDPAVPRYSNQDWTGGRDVPNFFSDGYPLLVLSRASIDDLAARVGRPLEVERFRPNLLLEGVGPYAEDAATRLTCGTVELALTKACTRCVITTVDPVTGERGDGEPLATLQRYRHDAALRGMVFGRNAYGLTGIGATLTRDMPVSLE